MNKGENAQELVLIGPDQWLAKASPFNYQWMNAPETEM